MPDKGNEMYPNDPYLNYFLYPGQLTNVSSAISIFFLEENDSVERMN